MGPLAAEELEALRRAVDEEDRALVEHLARRRAAVAALAARKREAGLPAVDPGREAALRASWRAGARALALPEEVAIDVLEAILRHSRRHVEALVGEGGDGGASRG